MIAALRRKAGFTLVELLVVVAIIAVLIAILLPALTSARAAAEKVLCMTRLGQINLGVRLYEDDNSDRGPLGFTYGQPNSRPNWSLPNPNPYPPNEGWYSYREWAIGPYLKRSTAYLNGPRGEMDSSNAVFYCPTFIAMGIRPSIGAGYAVNLWLGHDTYLGDHVSAPASSPMLWCGAWATSPVWCNTIGFPFDVFGWGHPFEVEFTLQSGGAHRGSANFLFFDGHVVNQPALADAGAYLGRWTWYGQ